MHLDASIAYDIAEILNEASEDGKTYRVIEERDGKGLATILVYDENLIFIGRLGVKPVPVVRSSVAQR